MTPAADNAASSSLTELSFSVFGFISRPTAEIYEAVADPEQSSRYFSTGGAIGRLETGAEVTWDFADFPGAGPGGRNRPEDQHCLAHRR